MSKPPSEQLLSPVTELLAKPENTTRQSSFFQQQAKHYKQEKDAVLWQLQEFKETASKNQQSYDAVYHLLYHLLHHDSHAKKWRKASTTSKPNCSRIDIFIREFNHLFDIDKSRIIYINQPQLRNYHRDALAYSHTAFWDELMCDLFSDKDISFAPIGEETSYKLFAKTTLKSAGMIPFKTPTNTRTKLGGQAMLVFGSMDEARFLPDSTYHLDLLARIQNILSSL